MTRRAGSDETSEQLSDGTQEAQSGWRCCPPAVTAADSRLCSLFVVPSDVVEHDHLESSCDSWRAHHRVAEQQQPLLVDGDQTHLLAVRLVLSRRQRSEAQRTVISGDKMRQLRVRFLLLSSSCSIVVVCWSSDHVHENVLEHGHFQFVILPRADQTLQQALRRRKRRWQQQRHKEYE